MQMVFIKKSTAARIAYLLTAADKTIGEEEEKLLVKLYSESEIEKIREEFSARLNEIADDEDYSDMISEWCDKLIDSEAADDGPSDPDETSVRSFISDLILMAQCDGVQDVTEAKLIRHVARKAGMSNTLFNDIVKYRQIATLLDNEREDIFASDYEYSLMRPYADAFEERDKNLRSHLENYLYYYTEDDKVMCCEKLTVNREIVVNNQAKMKAENVLNTCAIAAIDPIFGGAAALLRNSNNKKALATETIKKANEEALQRAESRMDAIGRQCKEALDSIAGEKTFILTNSFKHFIDYLSKIKNVTVKDSEIINEILELKSGIDGVCNTASVLPASAVTQNRLLAGAKIVVSQVPPAAFLIEGSNFLKLNKEYKKARAESADVAVTIEKMNIQAVKLIALRQHIYLNYIELLKLDSYFTPMVFEFRRIQESQGLDYSGYDENARKTIASACSLAKTLKSLIDTPLLTDGGDLSEEAIESMQRSDEELAEAIK